MPIEARASARSRYSVRYTSSYLSVLMNDLARGIVVGVAASAHADDDTVFLQQVRVVGGGVLHAAIGVMHQAGRGLALLQHHAQGLQDQLGFQRAVQRPTEDAAREGVQNHPPPDKQTPTSAGGR